MNVMDPTTDKAFGNSYVNTCDQMVGISNDNKRVPGIASWQILDGGKTLEFKLKQGIKFSSGDPLTSKDVEFSFNRKWELDPMLKNSMAGFQKFEAVDDYTVRFYFEKTNILVLINGGVFYVVSKTYFDRVGEDEFAKMPVGTGPYKITGWEPGQYVDFEANEYYWGQKPPVQKVHMVAATDGSTRMAMLQTGEVDIIMDTPWANAADLAKTYHRVDQPVTNSYAVEFGTLNPNTPWADKRVRQAISYAIDKEAICKNLFFGVPTYIPWLSPGELGYDPTLPAYNYDPDKAKQLMADAGYPKGFDMPLYAGQFSADIKNVAEYVASALKAININCKVEVLDISAFVTMVQKVHKDPTQVYVALGAPSIALEADPIIPLQQYFLSTGMFATYANPDLDVIINQALQTVDDAKRGELIKQAFKIISDEVPKAPLLHNAAIYMMKPNIDYTPRQWSAPNRDFFLANVTVK
jgi:peptide/nickel transport system substrate-binding protein